MHRTLPLRHARAVTALALIALSFACSKRQAPPHPLAPLEHPVIFSGCESVRVGPVCEIVNGKPLHVWLPMGEGAESFHVDGNSLLPGVHEDVAGGTLYELPLSLPAGQLTAVVDVHGAKKSWSLQVSGLTPLPPRVAEAKRIFREMDFDGAEKILREVLQTATGDDRCYAVGQLGQVQAARDRGDEAIVLMKEAIPCAEAAGRMMFAAAYSATLVHVYLESWRFAEARNELARDRRLSESWPEGAVGIRYYEEQIAMETGDSREVLRLAPLVEDAERRIANDVGLRRAFQFQAQVLDDLGRPNEALALLRNGEMSGETPFDRAPRLRTIGWAVLLSRELGVGNDDPRPVLTEAAALFHRLGNSEMEVSSRVYLARAALYEGDLPAARNHLAEAQLLMPHPSPEYLHDRLLVEADLDLASGAPARALTLFQQLAKAATAFDRVDHAWIAAEGKGRALLRLGRSRDALTAFGDAEAHLAEASRRVPLGEGRGSYLATRERSSRERVDALLQSDPALAFAAAREARRRIVREAQANERLARLSEPERVRFEERVGDYRRAREQLEEEVAHDWELDSGAVAKTTAERVRRQASVRAAYEAALASLPPPPHEAPSKPAAGELWLGYFPLVEGWAGFAATLSGVRAVRLGVVDAGVRAEELSQKLFAPFDREIASAKRIVFLPYGALATVDFHALPFEGKPLIERVPAEYSLDIGAVHPSELPNSVLVVADPRDDLPLARAEARQLAALGLNSGGITLLEGGAATRTVVEEGIAKTSLFYYTGHGVFGGHDGWESALLLGGDSALSAGEILSFSHVPRTVILSGCETARTSNARSTSMMAPEGLGIAQAFLVAGADSAVATTRVVPDSDANALAPRVYERVRSGEDVATALRAAQLQAAATSAGGDWAAFRALRR